MFRSQQQTSKSDQLPLRLESLEQRVLLNVDGFWDELGFGGASGGGITRNYEGLSDDGDVQFVFSEDSDPVAIWVHGSINEYVNTPINYDFQAQGEIYAKQFAGNPNNISDASDLGWWDLSPGSGDTVSIGTGTEIAAASGPNGEIVVVWLTLPEDDGDPETPLPTNDVHGRMWNGTEWLEIDGSATGGGISNDSVMNSNPDVAISDGGEIFVSYTATHPLTNQTEIVVKEFGFNLGNSKLTGPVNPGDFSWFELVNSEVGDFGVNNLSGISNDLAQSFDSAIALDVDGKPIVVWTSLAAQDQAEIYGLKWDGDSWEEIGLDSASESDNDGLTGISSDAAMSIQPDIAVARNGDIIVTWVGWNDWDNYEPTLVNPAGGQAGIYVKSLKQGGAWDEHDTNSALGQGIAPAFGWYYNPSIDTDSSSNPLITYQGFAPYGGANGYEVRFELNRDSDTETPSPDEDRVSEAAVMQVYASHFDGNNFVNLSYNGTNGRNSANIDNTPDQSILNDGDSSTNNNTGQETLQSWMPSAFVGPNDELIIGYSRYDVRIDTQHVDTEIFVQQWDGNSWEPYGKGSNSTGNVDINGEFIGDFPSESSGNNKLATIDFDNDPLTDDDILYAKQGTGFNNDGRLFLFDRQTGSWTASADHELGGVFDIRSEPESEFNITGPALLAYIDDDTGLPEVYKWDSGIWAQVGDNDGNKAGTIKGTKSAYLDNNNVINVAEDRYGISVQAGQNNTIFLAYLSDVNGDKDGILEAGETNEVVTRYYDGNTWQDVGSGVGLKGSPLTPAYLADFTGTSEWEITDRALDETTFIPTTPLTMGNWFFSDSTRYDQAGIAQGEYPTLVTHEEGVASTLLELVVPIETTNNGDGDSAVAIILTDPVSTEAGDVGSQVSGRDVIGRLDFQFELAALSDIVVHTNYLVGTSQGSDDSVNFEIWIDKGYGNDFNTGTEIFDYVDDITPNLNEELNPLRAPKQLIIDTKDRSFAQFAQGPHTISIIATMRADGGNGLTGDAAADELGIAAFDDFAVYQRIDGSSDGLVAGLHDQDLPSSEDTRWRVDDAGVDGNNAVGPDEQFDFQGSLFINGLNTYKVEDINQAGGGDMEINFRYLLDNASKFKVSISNSDASILSSPLEVEIDDNFLQNTLGQPAMSPGEWWNEAVEAEDAEYNYVSLRLEDFSSTQLLLPASDTYTVTIESLEAGGVLRIDNLSILTTPISHAAKPIATLLPAGSGGTRSFALGITSRIENISVYNSLGDDTTGEEETGIILPLPDGIVTSWTSDFLSGYHTPSIFTLDISNNNLLTDWSRFGLEFNNLTPIDLLGGIGVTSNLPTNTIYRLEDIVTGPNAQTWIALQRATSEFVDANEDGVNDRFDVHPWDDLDPEDYWNVNNTIIDAEVWEWNPSPNPVTGAPPAWVIRFGAPQDDQGGGQEEPDPNFGTPRSVVRGYTDISLASAGQPILVWNNRADNSAYIGSASGQIFVPGTGWGGLGPNPLNQTSDGIQNGQNWSRQILQDLVIMPNGNPITAFELDQLDADGIREFIPSQSLPAMTVVEDAGIQNDNILDFGLALDDVVNRPFSIFNSGPGDLVIYDTDLVGGLGSLTSNPFSLGSNTPAFPITIPSGSSRSINVQFDPTNVPSGSYSSILIINNSDPFHPTHEFSHQYELNLEVEVINQAEISAQPDWLIFGDTVVNQTSSTEKFVVTNEGEDNTSLVIDEWYFTENNYSIISIEFNDASAGTTQQLVTLTNLADNSADDITLDKGDTLEFEIQFAPTAIEAANEVFFISSNDTDQPILPIALTGLSLSGAAITVESNGVNVADGGTLDFGSVVTNTSDQIVLDITNNGTTDLTVASVQVTSATPDLTVPFTENIVISAGQTVSIPVSYLPTLDPDPLDPGAPLDPENLEGRVIIFNNDPDALEQQYLVNFTGLGVPVQPIISTTEVNSSTIVSSLNFGATSKNDPVTQSFAINNIGGDTLTINSLTFEPVGIPFSVTTVTPFDIGVGANEFINVTFDPSAAGSYQGQLRLLSNDPSNGTVLLSLFGSATDPLLTVSDTEIDFGAVGLNETSETRTVTLTNTGQSSVTITNWSITQGGGIFTVEPFVSDIILASQQSQVLDVNFIPNAVGDLEGELTITSDDPNNLVTVVELDGEGQTPGKVGLNKTSIEFLLDSLDPLIALKDTGLEFITITNNGESNLTLKGLQIVNSQLTDPANEVEFTGGPFELNIDDSQANISRDRLDPDDDSDDIVLIPGEPQVFSVAFVPNSVYNDTKQIRLFTSDPDTPYTYIPLAAESVFALQVGEGDGFTEKNRRFFDANGNLVQVKLTGGGSAYIVLENGFGSGSNISRIELDGTETSTNLSISSSGPTTIGQISGGAIRNLTLKNVTVDGSLDLNQDTIPDYEYAIDLHTVAGNLKLDDVNDAKIRVENTPSKSGMNLSAQNVEDSEFDIQGNTKQVRFDRIADSSFSADSAKNVRINSSFEVDSLFVFENELGNFTAKKAIFSGAINAQRANNISLFNVNNADISIEGELRGLNVRNDLINSRILAGFDLGSDGRLGGTGTAADTLKSNGVINSANIRGGIDDSFIAVGLASTVGDFFNPTSTAPGAIGRISIGQIIGIVDGSPFGVAATTSIGSVNVGGQNVNPGGSIGEFNVELK